ncbi:hypothetical protein AAF712_008413 [Marasmius tenuissimus]|uniref:Hydrophobin n=1 Tax=Marasmius tenuissimus TaxID=585030 RepID=A0ABR2ZTW5_9AGAR|nr:hypothetical protein PM082_009725 [Marasmius tenuissimus]
MKISSVLFSPVLLSTLIAAAKATGAAVPPSVRPRAGCATGSPQCCDDLETNPVAVLGILRLLGVEPTRVVKDIKSIASECESFDPNIGCNRAAPLCCEGEFFGNAFTLTVSMF